MDVRALVYAPEATSLNELRRVFSIVGLGMELSYDLPTALDRFRDEHYDCVFVDCEHAPADAVARLRMDPHSQHMAIFALVNDRDAMRKAYHDGATFTLDKPLTYDRTLRCLRAAYGLVIGERRRYQRYPIDASMMMHMPTLGEFACTMMNVSSGGFCVRLARPLPEQCSVRLSFTLPAMNHNYRGSAQLVWSNIDLAGFRFTQTSRVAKDALAEWLFVQHEIALANRKPARLV